MTLRKAGIAIASALGFALTVGVGQLTLIADTQVAVVAPAGGVAAVWFRTLPTTRARVAAGAWVTLVVATLSYLNHATWLESLGFGLASIAQVVVFTWLATRWLSSRQLTNGTRDLDVESLARLAAAAAAAAAISALLGPLTITSLSPADVTVMATWVLRNTVVIVALYPLGMSTVVWLKQDKRKSCSAWLSNAAIPSPQQVLEWSALICLTTTVGWWVFGADQDLPMAFVLLSTSVWAGARLPVAAANAHAIASGTAVAVLTLSGRGLFGSIEDHVLRAGVAQAFLALTLAVTMALALQRQTTERLTSRLKAANAATSAQNELLETILSCSREGTIVRDSDGEVVMSNAAAAIVLGSDSTSAEQNALRNTDGIPVPTEQLPSHLVLAGHTIEQQDYLVIRSDSSQPRTLEVSAARVLDPCGDSLAVVQFRDVTAARREHDELVAFAGVIAHDLLNPLTAAAGWSDALGSELRGRHPDIERALSHLARVQRGTTRMHTLINDLLAYTTARNAAITPVAVDLASLMEDLADARSEAAAATGAPPVIEVAPGLPTIWGEPVLIRQAFDNLLGNAIKYVAPGVVPHIRIRARQINDSTVEIEVADNGIGIPLEQQSTVFDTFHRAHREGYQGTGLGLSIVKRIAERHGGTASACVNADTLGTSMRLTLPLAPQGVAQPLHADSTFDATSPKPTQGHYLPTVQGVCPRSG